MIYSMMVFFENTEFFIVLASGDATITPECVTLSVPPSQATGPDQSMRSGQSFAAD